VELPDAAIGEDEHIAICIRCDALHHPELYALRVRACGTRANEKPWDPII
jgi:hypothetical protein